MINPDTDEARAPLSEERIYLEPRGAIERSWCSERIEDDWVEYVRADILASNNALLERAKRAEAELLLRRPTDADVARTHAARREYRQKLKELYGSADALPMRIAKLETENAALRSKLEEASRPGIYVASKAKHFKMWKTYRAGGQPISSTWIDEGDDKQTQDFPALWGRCISEAASSSAVVLYREDDELLKGALLEIGAAMAFGKPVFAVGEFDGTYHNHPLFHPCLSLDEAFRRAAAFERDTRPEGRKPRKTSINERGLCVSCDVQLEMDMPQ